MKEIIEINEIFRVTVKNHDYHLKALVRINAKKLSSDLKYFGENSNVNAYRYCHFVNCTGYRKEFDCNYDYCPYCGGDLWADRRTPTMNQFIEEHSGEIKLVTIKTTVITESVRPSDV